MLRRSNGRELARNDMPRISPRGPGRVVKRTKPIEATERLRKIIADSRDSSRTTSDNTSTSGEEDQYNYILERGSAHLKSARRPKSTHWAASTLSDAVNELYSKPQLPRRAVSARTTVPTQRLEGQKRRNSLTDAVLPSPSQITNPAPRALISRKKSSRKSVGRLGLKPNRAVWRQLNTLTLEKLKIGSSSSEPNAFSEGNWMKKSMTKQDEGGVRTNIVEFERRRCPDTPTSMTETPREFNRRPNKAARMVKKPSLQTGRRRALQAVSPNAAKHISSSRTHAPRQGFQTLPITPPPEQKASEHHVYLPGPIQMNQSPVYVAISRKASIATLEPFLGEVECAAPFRRHSDQAALDGIVAYFQNLGVVEEAHDDGLDQFWQHDLDDSMIFPSVTPPRLTPSPSAKAFRTLGLDGSSHSPTRGHTRASSSLGSSLFMPWIKPWQQDPQRSPSPNPEPPSPRSKINFKRLLNSAT